ncbi:MAG TPA: FHA domain-containing protein [Pyrinomonadaceae bacterium]|jgi:hypothetical protein
MDKTEKKESVPKRDEALAERLLRRVLDRVGAVVDRSLGRAVEPQSGFTTTRLIERMNRLIDERVRDDPRRGGRIAPHLMKLKIEWGTHSEAPPEAVKELENEVLAAAIDHINNQRLRTLAPVEVETLVDIFTTGIAVDPSYGAFEEELQREDEERARAATGVAAPASDIGAVTAAKNVTVHARINVGKESEESTLYFKPGGRRLSVGRATDCDLSLPHPSVSKIHAAILMNREGTLLVSDTGSVNGTFINGRRINYGEARQLEDGDVVGFGDVEVRFRKT